MVTAIGQVAGEMTLAGANSGCRVIAGGGSVWYKGGLVKQST